MWNYIFHGRISLYSMTLIGSTFIYCYTLFYTFLINIVAFLFNVHNNI